MSVPRFFVGGRFGQPGCGDPVEVPLDDADAHHAARVLRLSAGKIVEAVDSDGRVLLIRLDASPINSLRGLAVRISEPRLRPAVALFQGMAKGDRTDLVVEKVVEIGVNVVVPVLFHRSVVELTRQRRFMRGERLRRVALAAAKQSRRDLIPHVHDPVDFSSSLTLLAEYHKVLVAREGVDALPGVGDALTPMNPPVPESVAVVVGPEGGFEREELDALADMGAREFTLGHTILRTETAGIVASALILYCLGALGGTANEQPHF